MMREYPPKMRFFLDTANIDEIRQAAKAGAHIAAIPFKALTQMTRHPLTDLGLARFTQDWETVAKQ